MRRNALLAVGAVVVVSALVAFFSAAPPPGPVVSGRGAVVSGKGAHGSVKGAYGMPVAETRSLAAAQAFTTNPIRFLLLGDSIGLTLGSGLSHQSVGRFGVEVIDHAALGCDLDSVEVNLSGAVGPATPGCLHWRAMWTQYVAEDHPDVVGLLIGRWEVGDHLYDGSWVHVGDVPWDEHLTSELEQAFGIFASKGARVVVFTMPYVDPPTEAADGTPFSENTPSRVVLFNELLRRAANRAREKVTVMDLNQLLDPSGHFQPDIDGVQVRWSDGIHISVAGGEWLQPDILPVVAEQGLTARSGRSPRGGGISS